MTQKLTVIKQVARRYVAGLGKYGYRLTSRNSLPKYHSFDSVGNATKDDVQDGAQVYRDPAEVANLLLGQSTDPHTYGGSFENEDRVLIIDGEFQNPNGAPYPYVEPGDVNEVKVLPRGEAIAILETLMNRDGFHEWGGDEIIRYGETWPELPDVGPVAEDLPTQTMEDGTIITPITEWTEHRTKAIERAFSREASPVTIRWNRPDFMI